MTAQTKPKKKLFDGRYEIQEIIGRGSRSVVYRAKVVDQPSTQLAIKVLLNDKKIDDTIERLRKEALAMVSSRHEYTIRLDDFHTVDDICYLAMELAPEADLRKYSVKNGGKLSVKQLNRFFRQIAEALSFMHDAGMIHRDIKPDNFLIMNDREARLGDFGVTVLPGETPSFEDLQKGVGTMDYMAPEVLEGTAYNSRSDVYSLGVSFYEMFTGTHPFSQAPLIKQLEVREDSSIKPILELNPDIPDYLAEIIMRMLRYEPKRRFATAREVLQALKSGGTKAKQESSELNPAPKKKRRRRKRNKTSSQAISATSNIAEISAIESTTPTADTELLSKTNQPAKKATGDSNKANDDFDDFLKELDEDFEKELDKELEELFKFDEKENKEYDDLDAEIDRELEEILRELEAEEEAARKAEEATKFGEQGSLPSPDKFKEDYTKESSQIEPELVNNETIEIDQSEDEFLKSIQGDNRDSISAEIDITDSDILSELDDSTNSSSDFSNYNYSEKNYSLLYWAVALLSIIFVYKFFFAGSTIETPSLKQETFEATSESSITPKYAGAEIIFPIFPSGTYIGSIEGLVVGRKSPFSIISLNDGEELIVLVGIPGWTPVIVPVDRVDPDTLIKPLRAASNGIVLQFSGISSGSTVSGKFNNIITGAQGSWSLKAQ